MNIGMKPLLRTALTLLFLGSLAAPARADWFLTPYIGAAFGGASNQFQLNDLDDEFEQRVNFGGSFGWRSKGIFGFEVDYNVAPNFFQFLGLMRKDSKAFVMEVRERVLKMEPAKGFEPPTL